MHPKDRTASIESRTTRAAAVRRGGPAERLLFGLALLSLSQAGGAWASESTRLPPNVDTLIERDAPAASDAAAASLRAEAERMPAAPRTEVRAVGAEHGLEPFGRPPGELARLIDPGFGLRGSHASADATLADFGLHDFPLEDFAPREFRPHPRSLLDAGAGLGSEDSLMDDRDTWQRLASEYRAHRRVRVITLWDAGWSSLSLQAGKHGDPYLQWTGHLFGRSEVNHGLLDHWLPTPAASESAGRGGIAHALAPPSGARSPALPAISRPSLSLP